MPVHVHFRHLAFDLSSPSTRIFHTLQSLEQKHATQTLNMGGNTSKLNGAPSTCPKICQNRNETVLIERRCDRCKNLENSSWTTQKAVKYSNTDAVRDSLKGSRPCCGSQVKKVYFTCMGKECRNNVWGSRCTPD